MQPFFTSFVVYVKNLEIIGYPASRTVFMWHGIFYNCTSYPFGWFSYRKFYPQDRIEKFKKNQAKNNRLFKSSKNVMYDAIFFVLVKNFKILKNQIVLVKIFHFFFFFWCNESFSYRKKCIFFFLFLKNSLLFFLFALVIQ